MQDIDENPVFGELVAVSTIQVHHTHFGSFFVGCGFRFIFGVFVSRQFLFVNFQSRFDSIRSLARMILVWKFFQYGDSVLSNRGEVFGVLGNNPLCVFLSERASQYNLVPDRLGEWNPSAYSTAM